MMIDVWLVVANALWVVGMAVLVGVWSYAYYVARSSGGRVREVLDRRGYVVVGNGGVAMVLAGMLVTDSRWWAQALLGVLLVILIVQTVVDLRKRGREA